MSRVVGRNLPLVSYYSRLPGRNSTIAPFFNLSGNQQSITGQNAVISVVSYHTKVYSIDQPLTMQLPPGLQDGQLKCITFVHKGAANADITVDCPNLAESFTQVKFTKPGDQIILMWNGNNWIVNYTMNLTDVSSNTPQVI